MLKDTDQSLIAAIELSSWLSESEVSLFAMSNSSTTGHPKSPAGHNNILPVSRSLPVSLSLPVSQGLSVSSSALPTSSSGLPVSQSSLRSSLGLSQPPQPSLRVSHVSVIPVLPVTVTSRPFTTSSPKISSLPVSSLPVSQSLPTLQEVPVSSPTLPLSSPTLPTSGILSPSQIKQEPGTSPVASCTSYTSSYSSSILVNELLSRESSVSNSILTALQLRNSSSTSTPSIITVCKREPSGVKVEHQNHSVRVKEEYPDLCDMVGVDKTTYLEFLNNPILPSISEVEQLLEQCGDSPMAQLRQLEFECLQAVPTDYSLPKSEPRHMAPLSPSYQPSPLFMDISFSDQEDPSLWATHGDLTPLIPMNGHYDIKPHHHDIKPHHHIKSEITPHHHIKSEITHDLHWGHDTSNGGYDSSGPIESPRSTGSLESDEAESRLPTAVENMEDVGAMTSQMEESNRLTFDDDFGGFEVDEKAFKKRRKGLHLWEFLLEVLDDERYVPHLLYWVERSKGIFKIEKSQEVAKLWGRRKQRSHMTYEHMSRAMRHYYSSGIMRRIPGKRLMYQFGPRAFATSKPSL